jgi:hypothetical protein
MPVGVVVTHYGDIYERVMDQLIMEIFMYKC